MSEPLTIAHNPRHDMSAYQLLDIGGGERLEQWGPYRLRRPDPRAAGRREGAAKDWEGVDAVYEGVAGRGRWRRLTDVPDRWVVSHGGLVFRVKLAPFKHTGVFPEQAEHWRWLVTAADRVRRAGTAGVAESAAAPAAPRRILNLFAYTGGATLALAAAGHHVTHVDASGPALAWARDNARLNDLRADAVRWIEDDALAFVRREVRRGRRYQGLVLDPPAFGRTPSGAVWKLERDLPTLLDLSASLLDAASFVLINDYSEGADERRLSELVEHVIAARRARAHVEAGRLRLRTPSGRSLDTGAYVRVTRG